MPLRLRLIAMVGLVLLISLACGTALVVWHAAGRVQTELQAALDVSASTVRNGFADLALADDRAGELRRLVATFNGNRHVRAVLQTAQGTTVANSNLYVSRQQTPGWFISLISARPADIRMPVPPKSDDGSAIMLQADPTNEIGEVWGESRDAMLVVAGFAALSAVLISVILGHALRSLEALTAAFGQIGNGDYHSTLPVRGPPELARLANGFNLMQGRLAAVAAQNRRLNERLLTLQAEERADLARDLHDEIGPLLFAVDMTAATVERLAVGGRIAEIPALAKSIHDAVGHMQRRVRAILERLRPLGACGLPTAIEQLVAFWQTRRPDIDFAVTTAIEEDSVGDDIKETLYRVIQEGVSNAIRHADPARVDIAVAYDGPDRVRVVLSDDGIGRPADLSVRRGPTRLGLIGMRERVMAMAGSLTIQCGRDGKGVTLVASLPCTNVAQSHEQDAVG